MSIVVNPCNIEFGTWQVQFNNLCLYSSGTKSSCHAVNFAKCKRKFSVTGEGSKGQAETSTNGMSLSVKHEPCV